MKLFWRRRPPPTEIAERDDGTLTDLSPKREAFLAHARRVRNGQDVEMEQFLAQLRNKHF